MASWSSLARSIWSTLAENSNEITHEQSLDSRPLIESRAKEGTPAFRPLSIGKARIEGTFSKIAYCTFKKKPACLIVIDLDFEYHNGCLFKDARIRLTIENESRRESDGTEKAENCIPSVSSPKSVLQFGPRDHFGITKPIVAHESYEFAGGHVGNSVITGPEIKMSRRSTVVQECRWQVQGRADREPRSQIYTWSAFGNKIASKDVASDKAFPRKLSVWMVVEHGNERFHADIEVTGRRRGDWLRQSWSSGNDMRGVDRKVFEPASSTKNLDVVKLREVIDTGNGSPGTCTSELDLESCFAMTAVLSNPTDEGKPEASSISQRRKKLRRYHQVLE